MSQGEHFVQALMIFFYWFGFLNHELPSALVPCVQGHLRCCTEQGIKVVLQS